MSDQLLPQDEWERGIAKLLPSPHPLDYDWRYDETTARTLATLLRDAGPVIALGAPSVARLLESDGIDVVLVDRQPVQFVRRHVVADVLDFVPDRTYRTAIIDAPWYPEQMEEWAKIAAQAVGVCGTILLSVWPRVTRPNAEAELQSTLGRLSSWAHVRRGLACLTYKVPRFEVVASRMNKEPSLSHSPGFGELVRLDVRSLPLTGLNKQRKESWARFIIEDYQIAIRRANRLGPVEMEQLPTASGWQWPFVSARIPAIDHIDMWSSEGEVAALGSPARMVEIVQGALKAKGTSEFEQALIDAPAFLGWRIPRPPYRRSIAWLHRQ